MKSNTITNFLLALIAVLLLANLLIKLPAAKVEAETFRIDDCVTAKPGDRPAGFVHVVVED
jgi:hypothetical protein